LIAGLTFFPTNSPDGYTYLEEYLHFLAIPHGTVTRNLAGAPTFLDADLRMFTSGFTNAPVFTLSHVTNGTAVLQPDGFTARFTPTVDFFGRARFDFTVTDAAGSTWRQTLGILVSPAGVPRSLVWAGDGASNDWDAAAANWLNGTDRVAFGVQDVVLFDDRGSASPAVDLSAPLAPGALTVNANQGYTIAGTGSLYGALALEKLGPGVLTLSTSNSFSGGTRIAGGRITLANDLANAHGLGTGPITFEGGTLRMYDNNSTFNGATYHLVVPAGSVGHLDADGRVDLYGTLTGAGTLNLKAPYVRTTLYGDWSGFGGHLNVSNATFQTFSTNGFGGATVALGPSAGLQYGGAVGSGGNMVELGALSGEPTATLRGGTTGGGLVLTWAVGGLGTDAHFAGAAAEQDADSTTALRKVGAGTWTIGGVCTHRGGTTVSNGLLRINGALNESFLTVAAGATAGGTGSVRRGAYVGTAASLSPGDGTTPAGTLTVSNGLTLAAPAMRFDLSNSPTGANDRIQMQGGLLTMSGTQSYLFTLLDNGLGAGTYTLITGGTNTSAAGVTLTHDLPAGTRQSFSVQRPASGNGQCYVRLVVTGNAAPSCGAEARMEPGASTRPRTG
jgi:autotransporter-associated beta strand protein